MIHDFLHAGILQPGVQIDWPQDMLIESFQDGLNNDIYNTCISKGTPCTIHGWYIVANEVKIDLARSHNHPNQAGKDARGTRSEPALPFH